MVHSWDIWSGGVRKFSLPRSRADHPDKLLGKVGTPLDRHSLASEALVSRLSSLRTRLVSKRCTWDEAVALVQWIAGGVLGYAPLVGLPKPAEVHREDAALHRLIQSGLGVRSTSERVSLSASRRSGGLGVPLLSEMLVSSVAADLVSLLNGVEQASAVARDTLRQALLCAPHEVQQHQGLVTNAMGFLAGYGLYLSLSTDRLTARILDHLSPPPPQSLVGPFSQPRFDAAARFCRFGVLANSVRVALQRILLLPGLPNLANPEAWTRCLPEHAPVSAVACAGAARQALSDSVADWTSECRLFHVAPPQVPPDENWLDLAWEDPWHPDADARSAVLLHPVPTPNEDFVLFGDGGFKSGVGATFACQARGFGSSTDYWGSASWVSDQFSGRLPSRFGWEHASIHTAELFSLVAALRFRKLGEWHLLAFDRMALFHVLETVTSGSLQALLACSCLPLVCHLRRLHAALTRSWECLPSPPAWRLHQMSAPGQWNVTLPIAGKPCQFSRIAFVQEGWVGVHVRSHQSQSAHPCALLTQGNEVQDAGCAQARLLPALPDIKLPSGGPLAWFSWEGRQITTPIRKFLRAQSRLESSVAWGKRPVQGKLSRVSADIFLPALDPALYTSCSFEAPWSSWMLDEESSPVDLSAIAFRCHRAIGGSWTDRLHSHPDELAIATSWAEAHHSSARTCPLCSGGPGTARHVVMSCAAMAPLVNQLRDSLERVLSSRHDPEALLRAAGAWRSTLPQVALPSTEAANRWPLLSAWRWLVPLPARESILSLDVQGSSSASTQLETGSELAYRGVLPRHLGAALCKLSGEELGDRWECEVEMFATLAQPAAVLLELRKLGRAVEGFQPAVAFSSCLLLGLRRVRAEFQRRVSAWLRVAAASLPAAPPEPAVIDAPRSADALLAWFLSPPGCCFVRELRWALLDSSAAVARLRQFAPVGQRRHGPLLSLLVCEGVAVKHQQLPHWGLDRPSWGELQQELARPCVCPGAGRVRSAVSCWACGGADLPQHPGSPLPCPWCKSSAGSPCASCHTVVHQRGRCKWNCGAHAAYFASSPGAVLLCPDCCWSWIGQMQANPRFRRREVSLTEDLRALLLAQASKVQPGAGCRTSASPQLRLRSVRRWLLASLRSRGPCTPEELMLVMRERFPGQADSVYSSLLLRASRALQAEGLALYSSPHLSALSAR